MVDRSFDGAWANRVHADFKRRQFLRDRFHHKHYATFRSGIVDMTSPGNYFMHRTHANDLAQCPADFWLHPTTLEFANRFASAEELSREIHTKNKIPLIE